MQNPFPHRIDPKEAASRFFEQRHPSANCLLLAGSIVRGEATASSDLDLVVLYNELPRAYRESLLWEGYPAEVFVHNPRTLRHFFEEIDRPTGFPRLMHMVAEGIEIPKVTSLSLQMKQLALEVLKAGPPLLSEDDLKRHRYQITDLVDDIRTPRSREELAATGAQLYGVVADFYFRSQGLWSATGKTIPRKMQQHSPEFASRFRATFEKLFLDGDPMPVVGLAEEVLAPCGSFLFEGYRLEAPEI